MMTFLRDVVGLALALLCVAWGVCLLIEGEALRGGIAAVGGALAVSVFVAALWPILTAAAALYADRDRDPDEVNRRGG